MARRKFSNSTENRKNRIKLAIKLGVILALLCITAWAMNNYVLPSRFTYKSDAVPKQYVGMKIAHIADLTNTSRNVYSRVTGQNPNFVVVTGNLSDENGHYGNSVGLMHRLAKRYRVFYTLGENDQDKAEQIKGELQDCELLTTTALDIEGRQYKDAAEMIEKVYGTNTEMMSDEELESIAMQFEDDLNSTIQIAGIDYGIEDIQCKKEADEIGAQSKNRCMIVATSNTDTIKNFSGANIDMTLSGGTYGVDAVNGQYKNGVYSYKNKIMFVSGGVGNRADQMWRFFNSPTVQIIMLSDGSVLEESTLEKWLHSIIGEVGTQYTDQEMGETHTEYEYKRSK